MGQPPVAIASHAINWSLSRKRGQKNADGFFSPQEIQEAVRRLGTGIA